MTKPLQTAIVSSMLPYFEQPSLKLGPFTTYAFGVLVVIALLVGWRLAVRRAVKLGLDKDVASRMCRSMVLAGFAGAWLARTQLYTPGTWSGFSSFGGLVAGLTAAPLYLWRTGQTLNYPDAIAPVFPVAWFFGRAGCFLAHDHRGIFYDGFLAVAFPEGARLDLGLIEMLFMIPVALVFSLPGRRRSPPGFFLGLFLALYGPFRVALDQLHIEPNPDRWFGVAAALVGLALLLSLLRERGPRHSPTPEGKPSAQARNVLPTQLT